MKDIAIYGAGGFGREVSCLIKKINEQEQLWNMIGFFDDGIEIGTTNRFGKILGGISDLNNWCKDLAIVMAIATPSIIESIVSNLKNSHVYFPNIIAPDSIYLDENSFSMGRGNLIMPQSLVSCNVSLGDFNFLNCGVSLGHEVSLGSYNSMMSYVKISGDVEIGNGNYFGICSVVLQGRHIGNHTTIGANSVIMRNTRDDTTNFGNPAIEILKPKMK